MASSIGPTDVLTIFLERDLGECVEIFISVEKFRMELLVVLSKCYKRQRRTLQDAQCFVHNLVPVNTYFYM